MSLPGKVIEINEKFAIVEVSPKPECDGCHACQGLLGGEKKSSLKRIEAFIDEVKPQPGDEVILDTKPGEGSIAALLVFGLPMLFFFLGLFWGPDISTILGFSGSDSTRLIFGFVFMALSFLILAGISKTTFAKSISLKVIKITKSSKEK
jgi:sigma-E factor negative regulatory protein RseC